MSGVLRSELVLIVDDAPTNIAMIAELLRREGFRTKAATNGEKALVLARATDAPDLILLDVMMQGMDGYETCRRLKADVATRNIPVIFLTAHGEPQQERRGFEVGAVDYVQKPFSEEIVLARVRTHLALRRTIREADEARAEADRLLDTLLPKEAADEIRSGGTMIPRRYDGVAVLFCDIVGFTAFCNVNDPENVVARLDAVFTVFEEIGREHGLEKIKTVGDAYMAAAGLFRTHPDPAGAAVRAGLAMLEALAEMPMGWEARAGMDVGSVVGGIVGEERYQFDIWGDVVNVAARLTNLGAARSVVVTETVAGTLDDDWFRARALGSHELKGKGPVRIVEIRAADADSPA